jgi:hypothetical protein
MLSLSSGNHLLLNRLVAFIGLDSIKKIALENKTMGSLTGDPRTKGFQDGKFQSATLEALLSLEDNFDQLDRSDILWSAQVRNLNNTVLIIAFFNSYNFLYKNKLILSGRI